MKIYKKQYKARGNVYTYWVATIPGARRGRRVRLGNVDDTTKTQAQDRLLALLREQRIDAPGQGSVSDWFARYAEVAQLSQGTRKAYAQTLALWAERVGDGRASNTTAAQVSDWVAWLQSRKSNRVGLDGELAQAAPSTVAMHLGRLGAVFGLAYRDGLIGADPTTSAATTLARRRGGKRQTEQRYITVGQAQAMVDHATEDRLRVGIMLARLAGLRANEIDRLEWAHIDFGAARLTVLGDTSTGVERETTKRHRRAVPIVPELLRILVERQESAVGPLVVPGRVSVTFTQMRRLAIAAGVGAYAQPWHALRASCQSDWLAKYPAMDVCRWLGNTEAVARAHYHQTTPETWASVTGQNQRQNTVQDTEKAQ